MSYMLERYRFSDVTCMDKEGNTMVLLFKANCKETETGKWAVLKNIRAYMDIEDDVEKSITGDKIDKELDPQEALDDISHELMHRHMDMYADGCDEESMRVLRDEIGKRLQIIRQALGEFEELKKEVVQRQETEDSFTLWVNELTDELTARNQAIDKLVSKK